MEESNTKTEMVEGGVDGSQTEVTQLSETLEQELLKLDEEIDLDQSAYQDKALVRRRGVGNALDLLKIILAYSHLDCSLRMLGMWCVLVKISFISKTALFHRLQKCDVWLGKLVVFLLLKTKLAFPTSSRVRLKLIDASVICQPGSKGTDWRVHVGFDLGRMCMDWVEVTDRHGGESFAHFSPQPGDIFVGDRGYAFKSSVGHVLVAGAWLLVRVGWLKLPFEDAQCQPWEPIAWLRQAQLIPGGPPQEVQVWISTPQGRFELRFLARALTLEAAEEARRRLRKEAKKNQKGPDERSLFAAGFVLLATNLPIDQWSISQAFQLYRFRWQVELVFKRLKSLLNLDGLRSKDPLLAKVYLLGKILVALIIERIHLNLAHQFPQDFSSTKEPVSYWRLTELIRDQVSSIIRGNITLMQIFEAFPLLLRYLKDEPRKRVSQRVQAQAILSGLCGC
jgi:hypothetical protein